jgi:hypothetical protein
MFIYKKINIKKCFQSKIYIQLIIFATANLFFLLYKVFIPSILLTNLYSTGILNILLFLTSSYIYSKWSKVIHAFIIDPMGI